MKNLFTIIFSLISVGLFAQTIYYSESFENGLPENWSVEGDWSFETAEEGASEFFPVPDLDEGTMALYNDDGLGEGHIGSGTITTTSFDLSDIEGPVVLEMFSYFLNVDFYGSNERAIISISTDGETYNDFMELSGDQEYAPRAIDFSEFAGEIVSIRFLYDDGAGWNGGWAIDEFRISDQITLNIPLTSREYMISAGSSTLIDDAEEGIEYTHEGFIINNGTDPITSYDVVMTEGANTWTISYTGLDVQQGDFHKYKMDEPVVVEGFKTYIVSIVNVNGDPAGDREGSDNSDTFILNSYTALHPNKGVLAEMATSTGCAQCPRGTVNMDEMVKRFPNNFIGIAVHNQDPMTDADYDAAITDFDLAGLPAVVMERDTIINPSNLPAISLSMMNEAPVAALTVGAVVSNNIINTSIKIDFLTDVSDAYNVAIVITEDGVTGSTADGFTQENIFAGGSTAMGGFEFLPSVVPASFNEFNHVGRFLVDGFSGNSEALDALTYTAGMSDSYVFDEVSLPSNVNMEKLQIIGVLIDRLTGRIVNATRANIFDAASNGLFDNTSTREVFDASLAEIYPNPVNGIANILLNLDDSSDVNITLINSLGQTVATNHYTQQSGSVSLQQDMTSLAEGMYFVNITAGDRFITKKINKINQ